MEQARREQLQQLAQRIRAMDAAERDALATRIGTITAEGRRLSPFNCCYLWTQAGRALAQVGGFRQWRKAGRTVRRGEHAIGYIYVPTGKPGETAPKDEAEATEDGGRVRFVLVPVFAVEQTEALVDQPLALMH